jgi:hypothetical protein
MAFCVVDGVLCRENAARQKGDYRLTALDPTTTCA